MTWRAGRPDTRAAAAVGRLYLRQCPQEASATWLEQRLFGGKLSAPGQHAGNDGPFDRLRQARQQDFRDGDVVVLDGWFFARTEARLLALISLRTA